MKCGGRRPRRKAGLGADGALMAAATLAAAGMNVAATTMSAKQQADATVKNAETQAKSIAEQTKNNTQLQKDSLSFQAEQKQQDRDLMNDINLTMQMMAGRQNANDILNANRMQAKYGKGRSKLRSVQPFYGGANSLVETTDGGRAIPIQIDNNGYGIYELRGDNHEQYHKAQGGRYKSGVGVRTQSGEIVEGEGSKTNSPGELYIKDYDGDYFLSKHNIGGFNPTKAVLAGVNPRQAYMIQELYKDSLGLNDDGSKAKYGGRYKLRCGGKRRKAKIGYNPWNDYDSPLYDGTATRNYTPISAAPNNTSGNTNGNTNNNATRSSGWDSYGGAIIGAGANVLGAGLNWLGNYFAGKRIAKANQQAADTLADAYGRLQTIDMDIADKEYGWSESAPQALAVIQEAHISDKPQQEKINRDARYEENLINRSTMSSAARQQRQAASDDRRHQRLSELGADTYNKQQSITQNNIGILNNMINANAQRDIEWRKDNTAARLSLAMYNNDIRNMKEIGPAQAYADAAMSTAQNKAALNAASWQGMGNALVGSANGFASTIKGLRDERLNWYDVMSGATSEGQINAAIGRNDRLGRDYAYNLYQSYLAALKKDPTNKVAREYVDRLKGFYKFA